MILRHFEISDIKTLKKYRYPEKSDLEILTMINDWNKGGCSGRYFEMFTISHGGSAVGEVVMYEQDSDSLNMGINIFEPFRNRGFAKFAVNNIIGIAKEKDYAFLVAFIERHNEIAMRMFKNFGFNAIGDFIDPKGAQIYIFKKFLKN